MAVAVKPSRDRGDDAAMVRLDLGSWIYYLGTTTAGQTFLRKIIMDF